MARTDAEAAEHPPREVATPAPSRRYPAMPLRWTVRPLELGRTAVEHAALRLCLEVYDGGGIVGAHGLWRIAGRLVRLEVAAQC